MKFKKNIWLRHETKTGERRSVLTPVGARKLINLGHNLTVECSTSRIFEDREYAKLGCKMVASNSWITGADESQMILGLKELENETFPLKHTHIHFAHVFKNQAGWQLFLERFKIGCGRLYDLEFLCHGDRQRIAAFGHWAGYVGAALSVKYWVHYKLKEKSFYRELLTAYKSKIELESYLKEQLSISKESPTAIIIGGNGRCGLGAQELYSALGIRTTSWDMQDTLGGGPFKEILKHDILLNAVYLTNEIPPFLTNKFLESNNKKLSIISDVSCDPTGPNNPLPIYSRSTTLQEPVIDLKNGVLVTAIDHLPALLPIESSYDFERQFLPHLVDFLESDTLPHPFKVASELFDYKMAKI